ncbi:MAG TPA: ferrous iron transport protein B [Spirochaetaceae bacterium]|nr:ferrous iron transport protein B [Spirochaetaceae bacterium]
MTLKDLTVGQSCEVTRVGADGALRQHFLDMGIIPGTRITVAKYAPLGDPIEVTVRGYELTLRLEDAERIEVKQSVGDSYEINEPSVSGKTAHPGLGEGGRFHPKGSGNPLPDEAVMKFVLVGNQNCGKTTLFNRLTGMNQHVGNFPGVTVDRKDGAISGYAKTLVTDLPGIYSMSPYTNEEIVSRDFIIGSKPNGIINIVDATNIERNLYLTMQLIEMGIPMVVALNMMDELTANGGSIDVNAMEVMLGVPVVLISAAKNEGIPELIGHALHVARYQEKPLRQDFCDENDNGGAVHRCIHAISHLIEDHAKNAGLPVRFAACKVIEGDDRIISQLHLDDNETEMMEHIIVQMESERGLDRSAAVAEMRFEFIGKVCRSTVRKPNESKERMRSDRIDRFLTGRFTAIPAFLCIMSMVFWLSFDVIGKWLQNIMAMAIDGLSAIVGRAMSASGVNEVIQNLVTDGIFAGVGSVLSFMPIIVTMFFFLSVLEDSGYIARVAFFMDKLLRKISLSGRSVVSMLIGFGCTVPAVMSTRTLPSEHDRKMTVLLTPFMSCSAKVPMYSFFAAAFFPKYGWLVMISLYAFGILLAILLACLYKGAVFKGGAAPFVMELPNYRMPGAKNVAQLLWEKAKDFLQRAFSVVLIATIAVWFLKKFDIHLNVAAQPHDSILAVMSGFLTPLMRPLGLGDWRICTSLVCGVMAKESVVSTMEILFENGLRPTLNALSAATLMVFSLLYTPCVAAIVSIRRELGRGWAAFVVVWQCAVAWVIAFAARLVLALFTGGGLP